MANKLGLCNDTDVCPKLRNLYHGLGDLEQKVMLGKMVDRIGDVGKRVANTSHDERGELLDGMKTWPEDPDSSKKAAYAEAMGGSSSSLTHVEGGCGPGVIQQILDAPGSKGDGWNRLKRYDRQ